MAESLGAWQVEATLRESIRDLAKIPTEHLDFWVKSRTYGGPHSKPSGFPEELIHDILRARFWDPVRDGICTYGEAQKQFKGTDRLHVALAEWVAREMPTKIMQPEEITEVQERNEIWSLQNFPDYEVHNAKYLPDFVQDHFKKTGLQYWREFPNHPRAREEGASVRKLENH